MSFYEPLGGDRYWSTTHTAGPWTARSQHLGPPSALLARALEALPSAVPTLITRVTVEILGPVPVADVEVTAAIERPGRSVELLRAELRANDRVAARAAAWRVATADTSAVATGDDVPPLAPPESGTPISRPEGWGPGYLDALEWRSLKGSLGEPGPATIWARQLVPLVPGETPTGLQRLLTVADSGSGASGSLDPREWWFINTELTVHLTRHPVGEWIGLDAHSILGPSGTGLALSTLHDEQGAAARGAQALMVRKREPEKG
ncbi:thioesterase family protein [Actinokineospora auranticolor]|uniref:Thioesterase superfamily protein n=1 Tax=Actinokineospora auranticolor TaxID=155976 RepID=A0A2S6H0L2_9PSEU|nr:thioesterase family protein [Actinokineospora auranticolor]PPK71019.1 thioesterase superfamily protein [Actinokineospora auranticolor]